MLYNILYILHEQTRLQSHLKWDQNLYTTLNGKIKSIITFSLYVMLNNIFKMYFSPIHRNDK